MTKLITIDPRQQRQRATLVLPEIPINSYVSDPALEAAMNADAVDMTEVVDTEDTTASLCSR